MTSNSELELVQGSYEVTQIVNYAMNHTKMNLMYRIQVITLFRLCYYTVESTNKKSEFMKCLNSSHKLACLQCSFSDKELSEFIQFKK